MSSKVDNLKNTLEVSIDVLTQNRKIVNKELLALIRKFIDELHSYPTAQQLALQISKEVPIDDLFKTVYSILDTEEKLIGTMGVSLENLLVSLLSRPILLDIIAKFI